jgi:hypothetical protein
MARPSGASILSHSLSAGWRHPCFAREARFDSATAAGLPGGLSGIDYAVAAISE